LVLTELNSLGRTWSFDSILAGWSSETGRLTSKKDTKDFLVVNFFGSGSGRGGVGIDGKGVIGSGGRGRCGGGPFNGAKTRVWPYCCCCGCRGGCDALMVGGGEGAAFAGSTIFAGALVRAVACARVLCCSGWTTYINRSLISERLLKHCPKGHSSPHHHTTTPPQLLSSHTQSANPSTGYLLTGEFSLKPAVPIGPC
jgi:hypothetical protein